MRIQYQMVYWRDIPTMLRVGRGRARLSHALPEIFQKTVYRAAYRAKAITGDGFEEGWRTEEREVEIEREQELEGEIELEGELEWAAHLLAEELVAAYGEERLNELALNKGVDPARES